MSCREENAVNTYVRLTRTHTKAFFSENLNADIAFVCLQKSSTWRLWFLMNADKWVLASKLCKPIKTTLMWQKQNTAAENS